MKLTRSQLRRMILKEMRVLSEYDGLYPQQQFKILNDSEVSTEIYTKYTRKGMLPVVAEVLDTSDQGSYGQAHLAAEKQWKADNKDYTNFFTGRPDYKWLLSLDSGSRDNESLARYVVIFGK